MPASADASAALADASAADVAARLADAAAPAATKAAKAAKVVQLDEGGEAKAMEQEQEERPDQLFGLGSTVYIPRSHGGESAAYVAEYTPPRVDDPGSKGVYKVELDERGSGRFKLATEDFLSLAPKGVATMAPAGMRLV